jgi:hypothetical protein
MAESDEEQMQLQGGYAPVSFGRRVYQ